MFAHLIFTIIGILWVGVSGIRGDIPAFLSWGAVTMYTFHNFMKESFDQ